MEFYTLNRVGWHHEEYLIYPDLTIGRLNTDVRCMVKSVSRFQAKLRLINNQLYIENFGRGEVYIGRRLLKNAILYSLEEGDYLSIGHFCDHLGLNNTRHDFLYKICKKFYNKPISNRCILVQPSYIEREFSIICNDEIYFKESPLLSTELNFRPLTFVSDEFFKEK
jgi:hypothetical protein